MRFKLRMRPLLAASAGVAVLAVPSAASAHSTARAATALPTVTLQLKWLVQDQFGGYIAALKNGYYRQQGLNVKLVNGSPDIVSEDTVAEKQVDYAVAWVPDALAAREKVGDIVDVAQIYQRPGLEEYTLKSSGITTVKDLAGKKVGVNGAGNDVDVLAALTKAGINPETGVTLVQQNGNVMGLLNGQLDAAQGASYNELGQLLSTKNPATGKLYTLSDFNILNWGQLGTGMLEDGLWANATRLQDSATYRKETQEFVTASLEGWIYCRDHVIACRNDATEAGSTLGASLQEYQMNGVNQLIWPSPKGIGMVNTAAWNNTVSIARNTKETDGIPLLPAAPKPGGYDMTYVENALKILKAKGLNVTGDNYKPIKVTLKLNGD